MSMRTYPEKQPEEIAPWQIKPPSAELLRQIGNETVDHEIELGLDPEVIHALGYPDPDKPTIPPKPLVAAKDAVKAPVRSFQPSFDYVIARNRLKDESTDKMNVARKVNPRSKL